MNPLPTDGTMTWRDAALVAAFVALSTVVVAFLPTHTYDIIVADPWRSLFDLIAVYIASWVVNFGILTGLNTYAQRAQATQNNSTTTTSTG